MRRESDIRYIPYSMADWLFSRRVEGPVRMGGCNLRMVSASGIYVIGYCSVPECPEREIKCIQSVLLLVLFPQSIPAFGSNGVILVNILRSFRMARGKFLITTLAEP